MTKTTAVILAGGRSSRMGENKALLKIGGKTILEIIHEKLKDLFDEIILITNETDQFQVFGIPIFEDIYPGYGPLSGIHSGLINSNTENNFLISCDMPLITSEAIEFIKNYKSKKQIILYEYNGYIEKLCGIYKKECITTIEKLLKESKLENGKYNVSISSLLKLCNKEIIDYGEMSFFNKNTFLNMNTKEDYENIINIMRKKETPAKFNGG